MRLFVSVDLPDDLAEAIADLQTPIEDAPGIRLTDPAQAHITMKFLGDAAESRLDTIEDALRQAVVDADVDPFQATFDGVGAFPSEDYIRVVWLGVEEGNEELIRLHEAIETRMTALGFDPEEHSFTPHVTLARMEHAGGKERVQAFLAERHPTVGSMHVSDVRLTESELTSDGSVYSTVTSVSL